MITEFILARIAEREAIARAAIDDDSGNDEGFAGQYDAMIHPPSGIGIAQGGFGEAAARMIATFAVPRRVLAECKSYRRIVELHESWPVLIERGSTLEEIADPDPGRIAFRMSRQIAFATQQEYVARFGTEPPTAPMVAALAQIWADHPDFDPAWLIA